MFVRNGEVLGSVHTGPKADPRPQNTIEITVGGEQEGGPVTVADSDVPPRAGAGSGRKEWAEFLDSKGIEYDPDPEVDGRNDLIAKWDAYEDNSGSEL